MTFSVDSGTPVLGLIVYPPSLLGSFEEGVLVMDSHSVTEATLKANPACPFPGKELLLHSWSPHAGRVRLQQTQRRSLCASSVCLYRSLF